MNNPIITVYSKPSCVQCNSTKWHLDKLGAHYEVVDMARNLDALEAARELGYASAPVVTVRVDGADSDLHWAGYRPDLLDLYCQPVKEPA